MIKTNYYGVDVIGSNSVVLIEKKNHKNKKKEADKQ